MTTDRVTARREAAVVDMWVRIPRDDGTSSLAVKTASEVASEVLAAADEWDRANGYVTIELAGIAREIRALKEEFVDDIERRVNHRQGDVDGEDLAAWGGIAAQLWDEAHPALVALRESAEREANR